MGRLLSNKKGKKYRHMDDLWKHEAMKGDRLERPYMIQKTQINKDRNKHIG